MASRVCHCGDIHEGARGGCPQVAARRALSQARRTRRSSAWTRASRDARASSGVCEDCGATEDLTGEHVVPLTEGGAAVPDRIPVLCRSCNSSRGGRLGAQRRWGTKDK